MHNQKLWRPAIEINLTEHCNLSCAHCDHSAFMLPTKFADLEQFTHDIEELSNVLHAGELKIVGGEPLLHPQLIDFLKVAKRVQIANRLVLLTNGVLLHKAPDDLWDLIDGMWISIYPNIKYRFTWEWVQELANQYNLWIWRKETPRFVENLLTTEIQNSDFVNMIFHNCDRAHYFSCHTIYEGRYYICQPSIFTENRLNLSGVSFKNKEADSVAIHNNPNLYDDLDNIIRRQEPLKACRYCLGSWARSSPNHQLKKQEIVDFLENQSRNQLSELVNPIWIVPEFYKNLDDK